MLRDEVATRGAVLRVVLTAALVAAGSGCEEGSRETGRVEGGDEGGAASADRGREKVPASATPEAGTGDGGSDGRGAATGGFPLHGLALFHQVHVYSEPNARSERIGYLRRGSRIRVGRATEGRGCREGRWHPTEHGGYVCSGRTMEIADEPPELRFMPAAPRLDAPTPYEYGRNGVDGVPLYRRPPTPAEIRAEDERRRELEAAKLAPPPDAGPVESADEGTAATESAADGEEEEEEEEEEGETGPVIRRLQRGFYVTIESIVTSNGRRWVRTAALNYVAAGGINRRRVPEIEGTELGDELSLPVAIVYKSSARLRQRGKGGRFVPGRTLERFELVPVVGETRIGQDLYYATGQGEVVPADRVRLVEATDPPSGVGADERWIDVNLSKQYLVAYEGGRPVYATLVATGKDGFETPEGTYTLLSKHISTNMSDAPDGDDPYLIEDVPWTMYFQGAFALHGAFWHSRFGARRSHGCVNLAPADARWIFFWVGPRLPESWHGVVATEDNPGTRVFIHE